MGSCGVARLLLPATVVAVSVASLAGNDLAGWIAGGITALVLLAIQRGHGTSASCAVTIPPSAGRSVAPEASGSAPTPSTPSRK